MVRDEVVTVLDSRTTVDDWKLPALLTRARHAVGRFPDRRGAVRIVFLEHEQFRVVDDTCFVLPSVATT